MRFLSLLLAALPLVAALPSPAESVDARAVVNARGLGARCTKSSQCGSSSNYCRRGTCTTRKNLGAQCYKDIGCVSNKCSEKRCVAAAVLTLGERCETSKSCASTYCGRSKCAVPQPVGADCYKKAGCLSGICTGSKCAAPAATPSPEPTPNTPTDEPGNIAKSGHFEDVDLAPWTTLGDVERSDASTKAYDGEHYAILKADGDNGAGVYQRVWEAPSRRRSLRMRTPVQQGANAYDVSFKILTDKLDNAGEKGCRIGTVVDEGSPADDAAMRLTSTSTDWKAYSVNVKSSTSIAYLVVLLDCPDGGAATVYLDDVNFVPTAWPEPEPNRDVAMNPGFESGKDKWTFGGSSDTVRGASPGAYEGLTYAKLFSAGGSVTQDIELPAGTGPFYQYDMRFKFRVYSYNGGSADSDTPACTLTVLYNDAQPTATQNIGQGLVSNSAWSDFGVLITDDAEYVKKVSIVTDCQYPGATAEVHIDAVELLSRDYMPPPPPKTEPTDVCRNGGFEQGADPWSFDNGAQLGSTDSQFGKQYALINSGQSIAQTIQMPDNSLYDGYHAYLIDFQFRIVGVSGPSVCWIGISNDGGKEIDGSIYAFNAPASFMPYSFEVTNDAAFVKSIRIGVTCRSDTTATVYVDNVEFAPRKTCRRDGLDARC